MMFEFVKQLVFLPVLLRKKIALIIGEARSADRAKQRFELKINRAVQHLLEKGFLLVSQTKIAFIDGKRAGKRD